jgi:hypothetical protein
MIALAEADPMGDRGSGITENLAKDRTSSDLNHVE